MAHSGQLRRELSVYRDRVDQPPPHLSICRNCNPSSHLGNFAYLFTVSLMPFSTTWIADTELAAIPVALYAGVFVLVNAHRRSAPRTHDDANAVAGDAWGLPRSCSHRAQISDCRHGGDLLQPFGLSQPRGPGQLDPRGLKKELFGFKRSRNTA
jgi:hypothetical protein